MEPSEPRIKVEQDDEVVRITFNNERISQERNIRELRNAIMPILEEAQDRKVVLDFENVRFIATPFFALLMRIHERVGRLGGRVELCNVSPNIHDVFETTHLTEVFNIIEPARQAD